jgi:hypothetical protein
VQQWIDGEGLAGRALTIEGIREIHKRFCEQLPPDLLTLSDPASRKKLPVVPGALRKRDVQSAGAADRLGLNGSRSDSVGKSAGALAAGIPRDARIPMRPGLFPGKPQ